MPRRTKRSRKPMEVDTILYRGADTTIWGLEVPLMLDRNKLTFFADYGTIYIQASTAEEVREKMLAELRRAEAGELFSDWRPVIDFRRHLAYDTASRNVVEESAIESGVRLSVRRYYAAIHDDHMARLPWDTPYPIDPKDIVGVDLVQLDSTIKDGDVLKARFRRTYNAKQWLLPYSDDLFDKLVYLVSGIARADTIIEDAFAAETLELPVMRMLRRVNMRWLSASPLDKEDQYGPQ